MCKRKEKQKEEIIPHFKQQFSLFFDNSIYYFSDKKILKEPFQLQHLGQNCF